MGHVDAAVTEMFRAVHMQLLGNTCRLEKLLLAALVMETRATGASPTESRPLRSRARVHVGDSVSALVKKEVLA